MTVQEQSECKNANRSLAMKAILTESMQRNGHTFGVPTSIFSLLDTSCTARIETIL